MKTDPLVKRAAIPYLVLITIIAACASPEGAARPGRSAELAPAPSAKRITAAISGDAFTFYNKLNIGNGVPGIEVLEDMVAAGLANFDARNQIRPQLGEAAPTLENGLWNLFPDGRMEVTWKIRAGAAWHDGAPFTPQDLMFSATVFKDPEVPALREPTLAYLEAVEAPDANTVVLRWRQPFIDAARIFTRHFALPIPKHLLAPSYEEDKAAFLDHRYWAAEFVHAGAYRVRELVRGSHALLEANERYVLGQPRIAVVEVKFIPSATTMMANLLSGTVELYLGRGVSIEQGVEVRDQWRDGRMEHAPSNLTRIYPKFSNPDPAVIANVRFRRALLHAMDRQQLIETFQFGLVSVTESLFPAVPEYQDLNTGIPIYEYDLRQATQLIESLGYARGADGFFRDAAGERLTVELRTPAVYDWLVNLMTSIGDSWQRSGVVTQTVPIPAQRNQDREYRFNRPGFHLTGGTSGFDGIEKTFHSSQIPLPARGYVGSNDAHYANPDMDALIDRYRVTIPRSERIEVVRHILRLAADDLPIMNVYFTVQPILIHSRIINAGAANERSTHGWNAEQWDIR